MHCASSSAAAPLTADCRKCTYGPAARSIVRVVQRHRSCRSTQGQWTSTVRASCRIFSLFLMSLTWRYKHPSSPDHRTRKVLCVCSLTDTVCAAVDTASRPAAAPPLITITDPALKNLKRLREDAGNEKLLLRMGVRSGGCSGMLPIHCPFPCILTTPSPHNSSILTADGVSQIRGSLASEHVLSRRHELPHGL